MNYKSEAAKLWHNIVIAEWGGRCALVSVDCNGPIEVHHLIPKGHLLFRNDPKCGIPLCAYHHRLSLTCSAHNGVSGFEADMEYKYMNLWIWVQTNMHVIEHVIKHDYKADCEKLLAYDSNKMYSLIDNNLRNPHIVTKYVPPDHEQYLLNQADIDHDLGEPDE